MGVEVLSSRAIIGTFYEVLEGLSKVGWVDGISMMFTSEQPSEEYKWLGMSPVMREWVGGRNAKGLRANGIEIENLHFEATLEFFVKELRRDKTPQIRLRIGELAQRSVTHWASLLTTLIENGEATACYDGQYFFDTDHSEGDSGTLSNDIAVGDYGELNVGTATNPTPSEMADVIMKMIQHQYGYKDDQGEPMNENAREFLVMVDPTLLNVTAAALGSNVLVYSSSAVASNTIMAMGSIGGYVYRLAANPRLADADKMYLFRTDAPTKAFIRQEESAPMLEAIAEGSEEEKLNKRHLYMVDAWRGANFGLWQRAVLTTFT